MGFERCHPAVNFIYFTAVIAGMLAFKHPVFLLIGFLCASLYCIKRNGKSGVGFTLCLLPLVAAFSLYYSSYTHFGVTVLLKNFIGNNITLESLVYGSVLGLSAAGTCIWFSCLHSIFTSDKVMYLFGKVSPRLSLFLAILLRLVPRIKKEAGKIHTAQMGIGRGLRQGHFLQRIRNGLRILSILLTWAIESMHTASASMHSRGSNLRGRTTFSIYRFDNRDRIYVIGTFACLTVVLMAAALGQTDMQYDPMMVFPTITPASYLFFIGYAALCLMPLVLELWTQYRFRKARNAL